MAKKRSSDVFDDDEVSHLRSSKKPKYALPSSPLGPVKELSESELETCSHEDLVAYVISLQKTLQTALAALGSAEAKNRLLLKDASKRSAQLPKTANGIAAEQTVAATPVAERAEKLADMCANGIKKQLKWQPSCQNGTARWTFRGLSPSPEVFFKMLHLPSGGKPWKQKKISKESFAEAFGDIQASVQYTVLRITSGHINVKWSSETNEFSISGTYGIGGQAV